MDREQALKMVDRLNNLFTSLVSDTVDDEYGALQCNRFLMSPKIRPALPEMKVAGIALTFKGTSTSKVEPLPPLEELRKAVWVQALESVRPGDVIVYDTNGTTNAACFGELMANAVGARGCRGAVVDGYARDLNRLLWLKPLFPLFATGFTAADSKGRFELTDFNISIRCGGIHVRPGDFILGDYDGVIVIPQEIAEDVITKSEERAKKENMVREAFRRREPIADVIDRYKVG